MGLHFFSIPEIRGHLSIHIHLERATIPLLLDYSHHCSCRRMFLKAIYHNVLGPEVLKKKGKKKKKCTATGQDLTRRKSGQGHHWIIAQSRPKIGQGHAHMIVLQEV